MMQASGTDRADEALKRFDMLNMMWYLAAIRQEVETTVSLMKLEQITDPNLLCNKDQIFVIAQIMKICEEDVEFLKEHLKKKAILDQKLKQAEEERLAYNEEQRLKKEAEEAELRS